MEDTSNIVSKVLVHESDEQALARLKAFFTDNQLVGMRTQHDNIIDVLKSNIDLGAVFLSESVSGNNSSGAELASVLHRLRPELPIFLRRETSSSKDDLPEHVQTAVVAAYQLDALDKLKETLDTYLFSQHYPKALVQGIEEITRGVFNSAFKGMQVECDLPYLIKDKFIYGELFSLMPLESSWCRGYMMFQVEEQHVLEVIQLDKTHIKPADADFRHVNNLLSELSNMAWGGFKTKFFSNDHVEDTQYKVQVPIIVNHGRKFISFGSDDPQLCFRYTLTDPDNAFAPIVLYQKFVFSLSWSPEKFQENQQKVDDMIDSGELELF